jgi:small-conductance mechanosensitive channel
MYCTFFAHTRPLKSSPLKSTTANIYGADQNSLKVVKWMRWFCWRDRLFSALYPRLITAILTLVLVLFTSGSVFAAPSPTPSPIPSVTSTELPVTLDGQTVFVVRDRFLSSSVAKRVERLNRRLLWLAEDESLDMDMLGATAMDNVTLLYAEDILLSSVSAQDAKLAGLDRQTLVEQHLTSIRRAVEQYRQKRSAATQTFAAILTAVSTLGLLMSFVILNNLFPRLYNWLERQRNQRIPSLRLQNLELMTSDQLSDVLQWMTSLVKAAFILSLLYFYFSFVFSLFPQTQTLGNQMTSYLQSAFNASWVGFVSYLPNLVRIGLIIAIAYASLKFLKPIFSGIRRQVFTVPGFYPEWAEPTYRLLTYLVFALTAAIIFPHLPGSTSPAFQTMSLFFGALISLGATSAVASAVAGFVLVYTRAFQLGDQIKVADVDGIVEQKLLLVTRIRTADNVLVTIPNSTLISSNIVNYSALLRDSQTPLTLSTTFTLGYDVPWRLVYETLVAAALATPEIIADPPPYVLQTALNDFYISYELNAYTCNPTRMPEVSSALRENIQDKFNQAGIEICAPHYTAIRDGNHSTTPADYLPKDYRPSGFQIKSYIPPSDGSSESPS